MSFSSKAENEYNLWSSDSILQGALAHIHQEACTEMLIVWNSRKLDTIHTPTSIINKLGYLVILEYYLNEKMNELQLATRNNVDECQKR